KRGYTLTNLNDIPVSALIEKGLISDMLALKTNSFTFRDLSGASIKFAATARIVNTKSSLKTLVFTSKEFPSLPYPVGYFNYYTFNSNMISDINDAMNVFKTAGIEELILDLRYNGGGELKAMSALANFIATSSSDGQLLCRTMHNDKYRSLDSDPKSMTYIKRATSSLNLKRIFILTSHGSASASEVLLNGLRPLMSVIQVGTTSYGKPNGMYVIPYPEGNYTSPSYVFLPICFYTVNKNGMGNFENGLVPDHYRPDDLYHDFGMSEDWTKACLTYIVTGKFPALPPTNPSVKSLQSSKRIPLEENKSNYGKLSIKYPF
ncbi:MAG: hypothetical protein K2X37_08945, partial [Chitinophagaceae bacterium]|nr:hypothetical protein [Chitinophagaceae bacterium]